MGFETNAAALLLKVGRDGVEFGRVLTLGHQHLHLDPAIHRRVLARRVPQQSDYVSDWAGDPAAIQPKRFEAWEESRLLRPIRRVRRQMLRRRHPRTFSFRNRAFDPPEDLRIRACRASS